MLPKRSTHVGQNLGSESIDSELSVAIFIVPRNLLVTLNDVIYQKNFQKLRNPWGPAPLVIFWRDIMLNTKQQYYHSWVYGFWTLFLLVGTFLSPR